MKHSQHTLLCILFFMLTTSLYAFEQEIDFDSIYLTTKLENLITQHSKISPGHIFFNIGLMFLAQNNCIQALSYFEQSAQAHPTDTKIFFFLGLCYFHTSNEEKAIFYLEKALQVNPQNIDALLIMGHLHQKQNNIASAIYYFEKAHELAPQNLHILFDIANLNAINKQYDIAIDWYKKMLDKYHDFSQATNYNDNSNMLSPTAHSYIKKIETPQKSLTIHTQIQVGELIDKITILQIKTEKITDPLKLKNISKELNILLSNCSQNIPKTNELLALWKELKSINEKMWDIEDNIRNKERLQEFDHQFIELARSVYYTNDERHRVKHEINMLLGSQLIEEKSHIDYKSNQTQCDIHKKT